MVLHLSEIEIDIDELVEVIATGEKGIVGDIRFECVDGVAVLIVEVDILYPKKRGYLDCKIKEITQTTHLGA